MTERDFRKVDKYSADSEGEMFVASYGCYVYEDDYDALLEAYEQRGKRIDELKADIQRIENENGVG